MLCCVDVHTSDALKWTSNSHFFYPHLFYPHFSLSRALFLYPSCGSRVVAKMDDFDKIGDSKSVDSDQYFNSHHKTSQTPLMSQRFSSNISHIKDSHLVTFSNLNRGQYFGTEYLFNAKTKHRWGPRRSVSFFIPPNVFSPFIPPSKCWWEH